MRKAFKTIFTILSICITGVGLCGIIRTIINMKHSKDYFNKYVA